MTVYDGKLKLLKLFYKAMRHELATQKGWFCYAFQDFETLN